MARVFNTKRQLLQQLGDFCRAWSILLEFIEHAALSRSNEVSYSALKSFQEILYNNKNQQVNNKTSDDKDIWLIAWKIWLKIGMELTVPLLENNGDDPFIPTQTYLIALVQLFHNIYQHVKNNFTLDDLKQLCKVLTNAVVLPTYAASDQYVVTTTTEFGMSALHDGTLHAIELVQNEVITRNNTKMLPSIFKQLLLFAKFTCIPPNLNNSDIKSNDVTPNEYTNINYIPFGEKAITMCVKLYEKTAQLNDVINESILLEILTTLHIPLSLKYNCVSNTTWKLAANSLISVLKIGLPVARAHGNKFSSIWDKLAVTLDEYLFSKSYVLLY